MKKFIKWFLIIIGLILALFMLASVLLYFFLPLDTIKEMATKKISESLGREVTIKSVSFNLFQGVKLKGLAVANAKYFSEKPFISADTIELKYSFFALFSGQVLIHEINLVKPEILVERNLRGIMSTHDLGKAPGKKKKAAKKAEPKAEKDAGLPINLLINNFNLSKGRLTYHDYSTGINEISDLDISISGITLAMLNPIQVDLSARALYQKKTIPFSLSGGIRLSSDFSKVSIPDLMLTVAGESLNIALDLDLKAGPKVKARLKTAKFQADPLLAIFAVSAPKKKKKAKLPPGALTKSLKLTTKSIPSAFVLDLALDAQNLTLQKLKLDSIKLSLNLAKRIVSLKIDELKAYGGKLSAKGIINLPALSYNLGKLDLYGFDAAPFANDVIDSFLPNMLDMKDKVEGKLDVSLSVKGSGVEMPQAFKNLKSSAVILLSNGRLKKLTSFQSLANTLNLNILRHDLLVSGLRAEVVMADRILEVKRLSIQDTDLQLAFKGSLDFNTMKYVKGNRLTLKFGPEASKKLPGEFSILKDEKGFTEIDFELSGSLTKPIPLPRLEKPLKATIGKLKVKIEAKKVELESKIKEEAAKKLEEEAKKKIKTILKF